MLGVTPEPSRSWWGLLVVHGVQVTPLKFCAMSGEVAPMTRADVSSSVCFFMGCYVVSPLLEVILVDHFNWSQG